MMELYNGTLASIDEGEIVKSKVLAIRDNMVVLDIGFKSEGSVPLEEFKDHPDLKPGTSRRSCSSTSRIRKAPSFFRRRKPTSCACGKIRVAYENDSRSKARSSRESRAVWSSTSWASTRSCRARRSRCVASQHRRAVGAVRFKIINSTSAGGTSSCRAVILRTSALGSAKAHEGAGEGSGAEGRRQEHHRLRCVHRSRRRRRPAHITDMSWGRISHPSELVQIGAELRSRCSTSTGRASVSARPQAAQSYPWKDVADKYPVGTRVTGKVVSITNYGAFIELEPGIEGLVRISEMSWTRNVRHPSKLVSSARRSRRGAQGRSEQRRSRSA